MPGPVQAWEVAYVRAGKRNPGGEWTHYRVKWVGYPPHQNSWEPAANLRLCDSALKEFLDNAKEKQRKSDGTRIYEGKPSWLRKKVEEARERDAQQPAHPLPILIDTVSDNDAPDEETETNANSPDAEMEAGSGPIVVDDRQEMQAAPVIVGAPVDTQPQAIGPAGTEHHPIDVDEVEEPEQEIITIDYNEEPEYEMIPHEDIEEGGPEPDASEEDIVPELPPLDNDVSPVAALLWRPPQDFGLDPDDRTQSFETVVDCLTAFGIDGRSLYKRVKADLKDPNDQDWTSTDCCPICLVNNFDVGTSCLVACTDKQKFLCRTCVLGYLERQSDNLGRVPCPYCRQRTYLVAARWIFVNNQKKRQLAIEESRKKHQKQKKSKKRQQLAQEEAAKSSREKPKKKRTSKAPRTAREQED